MLRFTEYINEAEEKNPHIKEIKEITKSVGGGTKSAGVFESWVHIVATLSGSETLPTVAEVTAASKHDEFHVEGKKWLDKIGFPGGEFSDKKVCEAIEYIGADVKKITAISEWGMKNKNIIHKTIDTNYYGKLPAVWKEENTKQNTADIVFITKGDAKQLSAALPNKLMAPGDIFWDDKGKCFFPDDKGIEWYQVSLKKGIDDARIGKLSTYMNGKYSKFTTNVAKLSTEVNASVIERGNYLGVSYGFDDRIDQILLDEGLFDVFKSIKDKIVGSFTKFATWAAGKLKKIFGGIVRLVRRVIGSNPVLDNANEIIKLTGVRNLGEEVLLEKAPTELFTKKPLPQKEIAKKALLLDKFEVFAKQLAFGMVNKEYAKIKINAAKLDSKKSSDFNSQGKNVNAVKFETTDAAGQLDERGFLTSANNVIAKLKLNDEEYRKSPVTTKDLFLPLKAASHYTAYNAINVILTELIANSDEQGKVLKAAMGFIADVKTEAKFGNTKLPLYVVYGSGGGAHYLGQKYDYKEKTETELLTNAAATKMNQPYVVIRITPVAATASTYGLKGHNVTEVHLMTGFDEKKNIPKYTLLNFTTSSGSSFSMKSEVEGESSKSWVS